MTTRHDCMQRTMALLLPILLGVAIAFSAWGAGSAASPTAPIAWDAARSLTWSEFRGPPPADAALRCEASAISMTLGWYASFTVSNDPRSGRWRAVLDNALLSVKNTMDPLRSWVAAGGQRSDVLRHEQRHFDLNECYRRQLESALLGLQAEGPTDAAAEQALQTALSQTAERVLAEANDAQSRYDIQTAHGLDPARQAEWDALITSWLTGAPMALPGQVTPHRVGSSG